MSKGLFNALMIVTSISIHKNNIQNPIPNICNIQKFITNIDTMYEQNEQSQSAMSENIKKFLQSNFQYSQYKSFLFIPSSSLLHSYVLAKIEDSPNYRIDKMGQHQFVIQRSIDQLQIQFKSPNCSKISHNPNASVISSNILNSSILSQATSILRPEFCEQLIEQLKLQLQHDKAELKKLNRFKQCEKWELQCNNQLQKKQQELKFLIQEYVMCRSKLLSATQQPKSPILQHNDTGNSNGSARQKEFLSTIERLRNQRNYFKQKLLKKQQECKIMRQIFQAIGRSIPDRPN